MGAKGPRRIKDGQDVLVLRETSEATFSSVCRMRKVAQAKLKPHNIPKRQLKGPLKKHQVTKTQRYKSAPHSLALDKKVQSKRFSFLGIV